jgi:carboxyl-terminal processing protease
VRQQINLTSWESPDAPIRGQSIGRHVGVALACFGIAMGCLVAGMAAAEEKAAPANESEYDSDSRYEDLSLFSRVLTLVRNNYVDPVEERELLRSALRGLLFELDPHSAFMEAQVYEDMQVDTKGEFHGLGVEISKRPDRTIEVISPIEGTPAALAGIRARDRIVGICPTTPPEDWTEKCRGTKAMTLFEAVNLMRGERGTAISIDIMREGFDKPRTFRIVRDVVKVASVDGRMLEPGYGYLRIRSFQERTGADVEKVVGRLSEESPGGLRGLVLDLRDNPGGLLDQAVRTADRWLSEGLVVYTQGREVSERQDYPAKPDPADGSYPMVVLVNEGSASASEIVAGALQDHHRALVLGVSTFGKGSVQTVYPLDDGSGLRLTTALYYTPAGRSIQEVGIVPDIVMVSKEPDTAAGKRPRRVRERDLAGHITHEEADPNEQPGEQEVSDDAEESEEADADGRTDLQLDRALEVLKSWDYFERLREEATTQSASLDEVTAPAP